ncbi:MAG: hypothetical protein ACOYL6_05340 [Bacteriovoracaceae bacterium]
MIRASIDIGSNTVLLLVAEVEGLLVKRELLNCSEVTALGKDLDKTHHFAQESMDESYKALLQYKNKLAEINVLPQDVLVTATEASRVAKNSSLFFQKIKQELGFGVTIISAQGEAHYSAMGAAIDLKGDQAVVMDIGGASTELIKVNLKPFQIIDFISMPIGSVRGTDWLKENIFDQKIEEVFERFKDKLPIFQTDTLCCVAGTLTSVANIYHDKKVFDEEAVHGTKLTVEDFSLLIKKYKALKPEELLARYPFLGKRSKTIVAGSYVGELVAKKIAVKTLEISTYGLRYGTLIEGSIHAKFIVKQY